MSIAIYTLTSNLHNEIEVGAITEEFLKSLGFVYEMKGADFQSYGNHSLDLILVQTGGTEGLFRELLPQLQSQSNRPIYLLTYGNSNSLAASMEILSFLRQNRIKGEIIHGSQAYITQRLEQIMRISDAKKSLADCRLGVIGEPSDWLISSYADYSLVKAHLGITLVDIPIENLIGIISSISENLSEEVCERKEIQDALPGANRIYEALKIVVQDYQLTGLTLRCFDLLTAIRNTGCLALAKLNAEGIVAGCEGDVPAMLSMMIVQSLFGVSGFQANPSAIDSEKGEILFAHCTIPLNMVEQYELDTHFESGIGVGIRGYMKEGPVTVFKISGDLSRSFIAEGELLCSTVKPNLCRTQQVIRLTDKSQVAYFLNSPIGNHHIILPGHHRLLLEEILK